MSYDRHSEEYDPEVPAPISPDEYEDLPRLPRFLTVQEAEEFYDEDLREGWEVDRKDFDP